VDDKETGRVEAFSDGVFAVAITLLVLNIVQPSAQYLTDDKLPAYIIGQWPTLLAFITSFATVGVMWISHHKMFNRIKYVDNTLLALNLLLLLIVVFIPYPTALLAQQYIKHPEGHSAAIFYTGTNVLLAISFNLIWYYASHKHRLLRDDADLEDTRAISRQYIFGPIVNLLVFGLAWINVPISILLNLLLALFFGIAGRLSAKSVEEKKTAHSFTSDL
jgi:uncharacterized membrane protein